MINCWLYGAVAFDEPMALRVSLRVYNPAAMETSITLLVAS